MLTLCFTELDTFTDLTILTVEIVDGAFYQISNSKSNLNKFSQGLVYRSAILCFSVPIRQSVFDFSKIEPKSQNLGSISEWV